MFVNEWVNEWKSRVSHGPRYYEDNKINVGLALNRDCNLVREMRQK